MPSLSPPLCNSPGLAPPVHPDPVLQGAIAAACESLAGMQAFAERHADTLEAGHSAGDLRGMNAEDYEALYAVAMRLYEAGDNERALPVILAVVAHEARSVKYSYLAGLCLHKLKRHRHAVALYLLALNQDEAHAPSAFRLGECWAALDEPEASRQAYELALDLGRSDERYRHLQSQALVRLSRAEGPNTVRRTA